MHGGHCEEHVAYLLPCLQIRVDHNNWQRQSHGDHRANVGDVVQQEREKAEQSSQLDRAYKQNRRHEYARHKRDRRLPETIRTTGAKT